MLRRCIISKQSNAALRVNFINKNAADGPCDIDKAHMIYIKSSGKPQISPYVQRYSSQNIVVWLPRT